MSLPPRPVTLPREVRLPREVPDPIPAPEALVHACRAGVEQWEMAGRRARAVVSGLGGVEALEGDGGLLTGRVALEGVTGANVLLGPRCVRRECYVGGWGMVESVLVPDALPGVVLQWSAPSPPVGVGTPLTLALQLLPGLEAEDVRVHAAPGLLWAGAGDRCVLLHLPGVESVPLVESVVGDGIRQGPPPVRVTWLFPAPEPSSPRSLLVMAAPEEGAWASLPALAGVAAHHRRGEIMAEGRGESGLELETGVEEVDQGLRWARAWLRNRLRTRPGVEADLHPTPLASREEWGLPAEATGPGTEASWVARAAAVSGDREVGRAALDALSWEGPWPRLLSALALARWAEWTGEASPLDAAADRILASFRETELLEGIPARVRNRVGEAVRSAAEAGEIPALRELPAATAEGGRGRRLPMAGTPAGDGHLPGSTAGDVDLAARLGLLPSAGPHDPRLTEFRQEMGRLRKDPLLLRGGLGIHIILALGEALLGARPDATFGRLALSPAVPAHWTRFRVTGLRTGESTVQMDYRRDDGRATWSISPMEGSVPLMAVFGPWLPWDRVRSVTVDGAEAELEQEGSGGWTRIHLQLPVDGERTVGVRGEDSVAGNGLGGDG